jgi:prepilin peptidase CpaA
MGHWTDAVRFGSVCLVAAIAAVTDWKWEKIYNWLTYPAMMLGFGLALTTGYWQDHGGVAGAVHGLGQSALTFGLTIVPLALLFFLGLFNGGDAKVLAALGAISANWRFVAAASFYTFVLALLMAALVMIRHKIVKRTFLRLFNATVSTLAGVKADLPQDSPRVPYGLAILAGTILAGWETLLGGTLPWPGLGI